MITTRFENLIAERDEARAEVERVTALADQLATAIRTMQAGLNSYHPDCVNEGQCYCRALIAVGRSALTAWKESRA